MQCALTPPFKDAEPKYIHDEVKSRLKSRPYSLPWSLLSSLFLALSKYDVPKD
jgi:hypothetical protein